MSNRVDPGPISATLAGTDFRLIASTASIGTVTTTGGGAITQGGPFDIRLIASTATIGTVTVSVNAATVTQGGGFDVRLIAGTATAASVTIVNSTVTAVGTVTVSQGGNAWNVGLLAGLATIGTATSVNPKASVASAPTVVSIGLFASPTLAANTARKGMWFQNVSTTAIFLGLGATPSATSYHFVLASATQPHNGTGASLIDSEWMGAVYAISGAATGTLCFGETT